jgi:hypothetical protein
MESVVSTLPVVVGVPGMGAVIALMAVWPGGDPRADLTTVNSQWMSRHRVGQNQDSRR